MVRSLVRDRSDPGAEDPHTLLSWHHRLSTTESAAVACGFLRAVSARGAGLIFRRTCGRRGLPVPVVDFARAPLRLTMTQDFLPGMATTAALAIVFADRRYGRSDEARTHERSVGDRGSTRLSGSQEMPPSSSRFTKAPSPVRDGRRMVR
jgi:hypothetical protein